MSGDTVGRPPPGAVVPGDQDVADGAIVSARSSNTR